MMTNRRHKRTTETSGLIGRLGRCAAGAAMVEFALITPILLFAVMGLMDWGLILYRKMQLTSAVRAGAQFAIFDSTDTTTIKEVVVQASNSTVSASDITITTSCLCDLDSSTTCGVYCDGRPVPAYMVITASYSYTPIFLGAQTISATSDVRYQ